MDTQTQADDVLLTTNQVRERIGRVSVMALWRWQRDERVQFPRPDATINGRNYWRASTIRSWQNTMTARPQLTLSPRNADRIAA